MRPQNGKRGRSRGRNKGNHGNLNRTLESNGPDVKIRGSAAHIHEKYLQLARDAHSSGDRVGAENYLQHAEHYHRLMMAALPPGQTLPYNQGQQGHFNGDGQDEGDIDGPETGEALPPQYQPQHANGGNPNVNSQGGQYNQSQSREPGEYREQRDQREYRGPRDQGDYRGQREQRDFREREPRGDQREYRDQQPREPREPRDQQGEYREPRREFREQRDPQPREPREPRDQHPRDNQPRDPQARDQQPREPREPREPRPDRGEGTDRRLNGRSRRIEGDRNGNGRVITTLDTVDPNAPQPGSPVPADDAAADDTDEALA